MMRRWRNLTGVRRRRSDPPWSVAATAPPVLVPRFFGARPRWQASTSRRGEFAVPPSVPAAVARRARRISVAVLARRGDFYAVPVPVAALSGPGPVPPSMRRSPRSYGLFRRPSLFAEPVWPQVAPQTPPSFVPRSARTPVRLLPGRKGKYLPVPPTSPQVPGWARRSPRLIVLRRSGEYTQLPPATPGVVVPRLPRRARQAPAIRRGAFVLFISPPALPPGPGPIPPTLERRPRTRLVGVRRGRFISTIPTASTTPDPQGITITCSRLRQGWTTNGLKQGWTGGKLRDGWITGPLEG